MTAPRTPPAPPPGAPAPRPRPGSDRADGQVLFPQIARLELDELLVQLVDRAQEVLGTQGRLRGLLAATRAISGHLPLPALLRQIPEAARDLVGARYAALGVVGPDGSLTELVTVGVEDGADSRVGRLPHGDGVLGLLVTDPRPSRRTDLTTYQRPTGHPPAGSSLGVPVRVRDEVFGTLYLSEKESGGPFTVEDEELVLALASAAGVALDSARLFETAQGRQRTLEAAAEISREILAGGDVLPLIVKRVRQVTGADLAVLLLPAPQQPDRLQVAAADGADAPTLGSLVDQVGTRAGQALTLPVPGPGGTPPGILLVSRHNGPRGFSLEQQDSAAAFADQVGVALELARQQDQRRRLLLLEDRERIARDLHDQVIQQLFGEGMAVAGLSARIADKAIAARLEEHVARLDETISAIRHTIFELQLRPEDPQRFRALLLATVRDVGAALGRPPVLQVSGPVDTLVSADVAEHAVAVVREALTNVARHARATFVRVSVDVDEHRLDLVVTDDGVGVGSSARRSGRANLLRRAEQLGGRFSVTSPDPATGLGTRLRWTVPTRGQELAGFDLDQEPAVLP